MASITEGTNKECRLHESGESVNTVQLLARSLIKQNLCYQNTIFVSSNQI